MATNSRLQRLKGPSRNVSRSTSRSAYASAVSSPRPTATTNAQSYSMHTAVKDPTGKTTEYRKEDDVCPVCKSDRFLNPKLRLLVSSCYHRMCESCIDRLFTLGPAPCPICGRVLRKMAFIPQTFEDLAVEKEVAVRRRIVKQFNKRREDFIDLRAYNDYLEMVEDIAFNLINGVDVEATEARIAAYREENAAVIELNVQRDERDSTLLQEDEARERAEREERAEELRRQEEEERLERERDKQSIIDQLERGNADPDRVIAKSRANAAKRTKARRPTDDPSGVASTTSFLSRTRAALPTVKDEPHVPLQDDWYACEDKFTVRSEYLDPLSEPIRLDTEGRMCAGGYRVEEVWERALRCAVMGLEIAPVQDEAES
ncbi:TFIIH/NER complex subunit [Tulasnella sp. JGI-2019a]|nr:TFIIH/NER complex subunit [Tulasnella sp. JGI-2019a]